MVLEEAPGVRLMVSRPLECGRMLTYHLGQSSSGRSVDMHLFNQIVICYAIPMVAFIMKNNTPPHDSRSHESIDVVLVKDSRPAASTDLVVEGAVVLRRPKLLLGLEGLQHSGGAWVVGPVEMENHVLYISCSLVPESWYKLNFRFSKKASISNGGLVGLEYTKKPCYTLKIKIQLIRIFHTRQSLEDNR